jgi:hypothetical protein
MLFLNRNGKISMLANIIFGSSVVLLAALVRCRNAQWCLKIVRVLIFLLLALRYDFGNDYLAYLQAFDVISHLDRIDLIYNPYNFRLPDPAGKYNGTF